MKLKQMIIPKIAKKMIRKEYKNSYIIYTLKSGKRIDILNSEIIKEIIEKDILRTDSRKKIKFVINLKGIKFIDSHGFRVLLELTGISKIYNNQLYFANISDEVRELIQLLELKDIFSKREIIIPEDKIAA
jgi:anti-anti-sigma factor